MNILIDRMLRAAKLETTVYQEVEADPTSLGQAAAVVLLSSVAAGVGYIGYSEDVAPGLLLGTVLAFLAWLIWAFLTWIIGTKFLPESGTEADMGQLLRTIGFSSAPGILRVVGSIPLVGPLVVLFASIWMLIAMVVAVRQALDYTSTWRAVGVCIVGWLILMAAQLLLFQTLGPPKPA